jgi:dynein heavy chain
MSQAVDRRSACKGELKEALIERSRRVAGVDAAEQRVVELDAAFKAAASDAQVQLSTELSEAGADEVESSKADIVEIARYNKPAAGVRMTIEAVCVLKQISPKHIGGSGVDYWEPSKKMVSDSGFLDSLLNFDKDNIPPKVIEQLKPYMDNEDFTPKKVAAVSKACTSICMWVHAMVRVHRSEN